MVLSPLSYVWLLSSHTSGTMVLCLRTSLADGKVLPDSTAFKIVIPGQKGYEEVFLDVFLAFCVLSTISVSRISTEV